MRSEQELLIDCLERLNRVGIAYMLVGSMASNFWGIPRSTHDLDFVVAMRQADVEALATAFEEGFFIQVESIRCAFAPPYQFNAIDDLSALKVGFWNLTHEPFEHGAFNRRQQVKLINTPAWITTAEDVILHKLYWNKLSPSSRQLFDAAGVYTIQREALDMPYLRHWATALDVSAELDGLIAGRIKPKST